VAPGRRARPGAAWGLIEEATPAELAECPFCAGREDRTPPEVLRIEDAGDWLVRVVPNLYPALERQEVVVHSPRHLRTFAELSDDEVAATATAWRSRREAARREGFAHVHALVNEGRAAGSSLPHSHSQLLWLRQAPPEQMRERPGALAELLGADELLVAESGGVRAVAHRCGRLPYELLIGAAGELDLVIALRLLRECVRRLRVVEGPVPWNAWLHDDHLEVVPRLAVLAGIELGAGIYVNSVAPEAAAAALRGVSREAPL
jgi:UDPglucose--hexose-1-phosphate uridylyltransferase